MLQVLSFIVELFIPLLLCAISLYQIPKDLSVSKNRYTKDRSKWKLLKKSGKFYVVASLIICVGLDAGLVYKRIDDNRFSLEPFKSNQIFNVNCGGSKLSFEIPEGGNISDSNGFGSVCFNPINGINTTDDHFIDFKVKDYKIILSFTVRDLKTGVIIAQMTDNNWIIKPNELLKSPSHEKNSIKIVDRYGYVAFELWQDFNKDIQIRGYSVGSYCTQFFYGNILDYVYKNDPEYEQKIEHFAERLAEKLN